MFCKPNFKRYIAAETAIGIGTAAASLIGSGASAVAQSSLNKKTREFNREEAEKQRLWSEKMYNEQNAWNYEMWNKQNEYNTPEAQVQRLRDAGLNPMFYGLDGTGNAGDLTAAQPLGYDRADAGNQVNPLAGFQDFQDIPLKVAQISNLQADTAKKGEETLTEIQQRERIVADIEKARQEVKNLLATEELTHVQKERAQKDLEWLDRINTATVGAAEAKAKLDSATERRILELLPGEKELQQMSIEDFEHRWAKIDAEIKKLAKDTELSELDIENYALNHMSNGVMGSGISVTNIARSIKDTKERIEKAIKGNRK